MTRSAVLVAWMFCTGAMAAASSTPTRVERLQGELRALIADLEAVADSSLARRRAGIEKHWAATGQFLGHAQGTGSPTGSVGCALAPTMPPDFYVAETRKLLADARVRLLAIHESRPDDQAVLLSEFSNRLYADLRGLRGRGFRHGRAAPDDPRPSLPQSASDSAFLVRSYCTQCHAAPSPDLHSVSEWGDVLTKMDTHAGLANMVDPESTQSFARRALPKIERYLKDNACDAG